MLSLADGEDAGPTSVFQTMLGIPRSGRFRVRVDPNKIPAEADLRARLFPSVLASTVDDHGVRWIGREAFPFACMPGADGLKAKTTWNLTKPAESKLKLDFNVLRLLGR
jgi:hypothetical protein